MASRSHDDLIRALGDELTPVRRLRPPAFRAIGWLAIVVAIGVVLAATTDVGAMTRRIAAVSDLWLAVAGSALTAVLAAFAAFQLDVPDRKPAWALLPLPAAALWILASGVGCFRAWLVPDTSVATLGEAEACLIFIFGLSVPLSVVMLLMLRRGHALQPNLTAVMGGLACAAAAATLLNFLHPYDAALTDLVVHAVSVGAVILANRWLGGRILAVRT
jgi:hypothetical protein